MIEQEELWSQWEEEKNADLMESFKGTERGRQLWEMHQEGDENAISDLRREAGTCIPIYEKRLSG